MIPGEGSRTWCETPQSWSLHCRTCLGRAPEGKAAIERRKESFLVVIKPSAMVEHPRRVATPSLLGHGHVAACLSVVR